MSHSFSTCGPGLPSLMPLSQLLADAPDDDDDDDDGGDDHNEESDEDDDLTSGRNSLQHPDHKSATSLERYQHLSIIGISIHKYNDHCHRHINIVGSPSSTL